MHLVQLFLPLAAQDGRAIEARAFSELRAELTTAFGGVTMFSRAPAQGLWKPDAEAPPERDDIVIYEVMTNDLDRAWWCALRTRLESQFGQEVIVIRAMPFELL